MERDNKKPKDARKREKESDQTRILNFCFTYKIDVKLNLLIIFIKQVLFEVGKIMILGCCITAVRCHSKGKINEDFLDW